MLFFFVKYSKYWTQHQMRQIFLLYFCSVLIVSNISSLHEEMNEQVFKKTISVFFENGSVIYSKSFQYFSSIFHRRYWVSTRFLLHHKLMKEKNISIVGPLLNDWYYF
jgi:hypothetical protein